MSDSQGGGSDRVHGFLFAPDKIAEVEFDPAEAWGRIGALLGDEPAPPVVLTTGLSLWTGSFAEHHGRLNQLATQAVNTIFQAVAVGEYETSLEERARVSALLAQPGLWPVVRGTCLLLGRDGDLVVSVPDRFATWWAEQRAEWINELEHRITILRGGGPGSRNSP